MRLSEERIDDITLAIVERLLDEDLIELRGDERKLAARLTRVFLQDLAREGQVHAEAVEWLRRHKPHLVEGTGPWEVALEQKRHDLAIARGYVLP